MKKKELKRIATSIFDYGEFGYYLPRKKSIKKCVKHLRRQNPDIQSFSYYSIVAKGFLSADKLN